jgi:hypothetical protein
MLRPTLVYTQTTKDKATLIVLADQSRSLSVRDGLNGKSRWELLRSTLDDAAPALRDLAREFEVKAYAFDAQTHPAEVTKGRLRLPESPEGRETAIGAALADVLRQEAGKRLLGVVLLSDGAQRAVAPRDLPAQSAAAQLKHQGDRLFTVVFGQSRGLGAAQDVAITELIVSDDVFVKNELTVVGQVRIDGFVNRDVPVRMLFETSPGKMEIVAQQNVRATTDGQLVPVRFTYVPETDGEFKVTLEAAPQPGELVTTNNELSNFVNVLKGGLNVLYVEGSFRVEQKFIRRSLDASRDIKVDYVRLDPRHPETRPGDLADLFRPGKYSVYIFGDVDSSAFGKDETPLKNLAEAVSRGAGLIMLGGFHSFGPGGYYNTPLADVLPVVMDRLERQNFGDPVRSDLHLPGPLRMEPTPLGLRHFALMLAATPQENLALWAKLPPLEGANHFQKLKPGAVVLADAGQEQRPLLVAQSFGNGRVMAFAADSTWRWWMRGFEAVHKRLWRQLVLWLARKDQGSEGNVWVKLERRRFTAGDRVEFSVGANRDGTPVKGAEFKAEVVVPPKGNRAPALLVRQGEQMTGSFRDTQAEGDYAVEVTATEKGQLLGTARARFLVSPQDLELDNASADGDAMASLAKYTGGKLVLPEDLPDLIRRLAEDTEQLDVRQETKKTFWDTWTFFLTLVGVLGCEWYLRKRWGLV